MHHAALHELQAQLVQSAAVGALRAACPTALEHDRQFLKGFLLRHGADPPAGHADGVPSLQQPLLPQLHFPKGSLYGPCPDAVPEDVRIVPAIVAGHVLSGFLAVLVLLRAVKGNNAPVVTRNGQQLVSRCAVLLVPGFFCKLRNDLCAALAGIGIYRPDMPHTLVLRNTSKGACFLQGTAEQQPVPNIVFGIFQKLRLLLRVEPRQAEQQHLQNFQLVVQKPGGAIAVNAVAGEEAIDHAVQPILKVMQEERKIR